ncbi:MAG: hypothetical protein LBH40_07005 [Alphaproteobacteria bacterium]|jgi:hypothetical protein|nr:hypothetical protein [Alphaproteobacteria bacterium]
MKKYIKYLLIFSLLVSISSCVLFNRQKSDAKKLATEVDIFRQENNNTRIEFLTFMNLSKDYSYVVDTPIVVERIINPNMAIFHLNNNYFAIEFVGNEMQSFALLKVGANILFQEGILLDTNSQYTDDQAQRSYPLFRICRTESCRNLARLSISYISRYNQIDTTIPKGYQTGDLHKFLVDGKAPDVKKEEKVKQADGSEEASK